MENSTKQDKLIFFGITFIALVALMFTINNVFPFLGGRIDLLFTVPFGIALIITLSKFGINKNVIISAKSQKLYGFLAAIWGMIVINRWSKYFDGAQESWTSLIITTFLGIVYLLIYLRNKKKQSEVN